MGFKFNKSFSRKKLTEIVSILWWESHTDREKLEAIWKVVMPERPYMGLTEKELEANRKFREKYVKHSEEYKVAHGADPKYATEVRVRGNSIQTEL